MVINISGTNGSGKSTIVRAILRMYSPKPLYGVLGPKQPEAYQLSWKYWAKPVFVLGPYRTPTGGADQIQPFSLIPELIEKYAKRGHVLFEGVLCSGSFGCVQKAMEVYGKESIVAVMDTSLEVCISNTQGRRDKKGITRPFDPKNLVNKYKSLFVSTKRITSDDKMTVIPLSQKDGVEVILKLLREAK